MDRLFKKETVFSALSKPRIPFFDTTVKKAHGRALARWRAPRTPWAFCYEDANHAAPVMTAICATSTPSW
jgi:hypothetical protein